MWDRDTFGPRLRSERERRGISIDTIVAVTKVGADLWTGLERNDFSKWPSGIFARAFVRDYARERKALARTRRIRLAPRTVAATLDVGCMASLALLGTAVTGTGFWAS